MHKSEIMLLFYLQEGVNGALVPPVTETAEVQQPVVEKIDYNKHRVYLLGENRWEDSSRLTKKDKPVSGSTAASTKQCITCRGEGRLLCLGTQVTASSFAEKKSHCFFTLH